MQRFFLLSLLLSGFGILASYGDNSLTIEVLHEFELPGGLPLGPVTQHSDGNYYGTTAVGGAFDQGSIFTASSSGNITLIYSFFGIDGKAPSNSLIEGNDGALYGTAPEGGAFGFGTLFKITNTGAFTKLVDFTGSAGNAPGSVPGSIILHPDGNFYGVTEAGGSLGFGTLFRVSPQGSVTTLVEFSGTGGAAPGSEPVGPLALDGPRFFGVTRSGGANGSGVIYSATTGGIYQSLGSFTGTAGIRAGANPSTGLLKLSDGNFYGATEFGGFDDFGVFFKIDATGNNFTVLHAFTDLIGSKPSGNLTEAGAGVIWGTTATGGTLGLGTLYSITTAGAYSNVLNFSGQSGVAIGSSPKGGLMQGSDSRLYGTASAGGPGQRGSLFAFSESGGFELLDDFTTDIGWAPSGPISLNPQGDMLFTLAEGGNTGNGSIAQIDNSGSITPFAALPSSIGGHPNGQLIISGADSLGITTSHGQTGRGSVFKLSSTGELTLLSGFTSTAGEGFFGPLIRAADGNVFGVSFAGGLGNNGTLFKIDNAGILTREFSFTGTGGSRRGATPRTPLAQLIDGNIYGVTQNGGANNQGTLFRYGTDGALTTLIDFTATGPRQPGGGLILASNGKFYGTTREGGDFDVGTIFEFDPLSDTLNIVASFTGADGAFPGSLPAGPLTLGSDGSIYGLTTRGGNGFGTAFRYTPELGADCLAVFTGNDGLSPGTTRLDLKPGVEIFGGINVGSDGLLYGSLPASGSQGGGVVFRLTTSLPFDIWKKDNLGDAAAPDLGDVDRDQIPNLIEYAFDLSPINPDNNNLLLPVSLLADGDTHLAISIKRNSEHSDVTVTVEASSSPSGPWTAIAKSDFGQAYQGSASITETLLSGAASLAQIKDIVAVTPGSPRFIRLRVTQ
jgi:uncharacterized repeat protein (TIGR03803 family)